MYIIRCGDGTLYTGYTTNIERRIHEHATGEGAKYTRGRAPITLQRVERYKSQSNAQSREYEIKQLTRNQKQELLPDKEDRIRFYTTIETETNANRIR